LAKKSHASALITIAKSKDDYFEIIKYFLESDSKSNDYVSSIHNRLKNKNKDDCFDILPPI
jgi:hypothetical protein